MDKSVVSIALNTLVQLLVLYPTLSQTIRRVVADFDDLTASGDAPTKEQLQAIIDRVVAQSEEIQQL